MSLQKKNLKTLVNRNFYVFPSNQFNLTDLQEKLSTNEEMQCFFFQDQSLYWIKLDPLTKEMTTIKVTSIDIANSLESVLSKMENTPIILVTKDDQIIGYLTSAAIANTLMYEYEKLSAYMDTILYTCEDSCTAINQQGEVVNWSKGAEALFSIQQQDIIGKPITDFFKREELEILKTLETGSSVYRHQHHAREDLVVLINSNPVRYKDEIIGAVVSEKDITSQIRLNNELYKASEKLFYLEEEVRKTNKLKNPFIYIRGNSTSIQKTISLTKKAATTDAAILIYGESGVGKELFAKAIHHLREQDDAPYVALNCGAISSSLFESEIFGYEKGAFSGADSKGKKGKAALAKGGTLFLDEIGEMPLDMQVKFLRLLQEKRYYPVGGTTEVQADFRIIAATNKNLKELMNEGKFREDLYYRLNVVNLTIPPLRERTQDIIELTHYFLHEMSVKYNRPIHGISQNVMQSLLHHSWPGNIRELRNVIERMVIFSDNGEIKGEDLPNDFEVPGNNIVNKPDQQQTNVSTTLEYQLQEVEREIIIQALHKADGNKVKCAQKLGVTRATLYNRIKKLNINL